MKVTLKARYSEREKDVYLPLVDKAHYGVFDAKGTQVMKYYDQTGKMEWLVNVVDLVNEVVKSVEEGKL